jgi:hypothetical protein
MTETISLGSAGHPQHAYRRGFLAVLQFEVTGLQSLDTS